MIAIATVVASVVTVLGVGPAAAAVTMSVDDAIQGSAQDEFNYRGSGWGHASGEGAPANPYGGTNSWTGQTGDSVAFTFTGTQLTFYGVTDPGHGIGAVSIDGGQASDVDFYSATRAGDVALWRSPTLTSGTHTFTLTATGRKNAASTGPYITVDRVSFVGEPPPPGHTAITVDPAGQGRTFDGIGAISGGGGNSRLLINYPEPYRSQILDYLFRPGYGASLQILKVEIGGDTNSTDGAEPSIEHTRGVVDCNTGYEWWLMEQAKARNPNIRLYGLAWGAPGWLGGGNFWSDDTLNYLLTWLGCAAQHGLSIDYLGGWNERGYDKGWFEKLHSTLAAHHLPVKVVGADSYLDVADAMVADPAFAAAVDIAGFHYPCHGGDGGDAATCYTSGNAIATGKQLWASENGSQDDNSGAPALIRSITRGYLDGKITATLNWPLLAAIYPNLPYNTVGLMVANQPWSGAYQVGTSLWATAQITQTTQPGWRFVDSGSGYLAGGRSNGSYVTLTSPDGANYSTIIETTTALSDQTADVSVAGGLADHPVHVWATDLGSNNPADGFVHTADVTPSNGHFSLTLKPNHIYTLTTTTGQGRSTAQSPPEGRLGLPYTDNFEQDQPGREAKYLSDMQGAFETVPCTGRSGTCVQQMAPTRPIEWQDDSEPFALLGDTGWANYTVSSDVLLRQPGTVELIGRAGQQQRPQSHQAGYYLRVADTGAWQIRKNDTNGVFTTLAQGTAAALGTGTWHTLALSFNGTTITASVDGTRVGAVDDGSYSTGLVGLGVVDYQTDQFDNLRVIPRNDPPAPPATLAVDVPTVIHRGESATMKTTFTVPTGASAAADLTLAPTLPAGWTVQPGPASIGTVLPGRSATASWTITAPTALNTPVTANLTATATYRRDGVDHWTRASAAVSTPIPAPTGTVYASDLSFVSNTNGWGPVERDMSNGEQAAGDGHPISLRGTTYAKGLGVHANGDVALFLGGNCTRFTAVVGIDDEVTPNGSVSFSVVADGTTLVTTPTLTGTSAPLPLDLDVTGARQLDLLINDAGDGNGHDHGDWANAKLVCASG
jgi:hypothetical protein